MRKKIKAHRIRHSVRSGVRAELTLDELWDLTLGASDQFADDAERRANYFRHRDRLIAHVNLTSRPQSFWDYEDVPDDCRGTLWADDYDELQERRRAWLQGAGAHHLREGEREMFERVRVSLRR